MPRIPRSRLLTILLLVATVLAPLTASPPPASAAAGFVTIRGSKFIYDGQPITLKGVNYYPQRNPWARMWELWQGPTVEQDMAMLAGWGVNVVRVLVPYGSDNFDWTDESGRVNPDKLRYLQEMVQAAGRHGIKVNVALFDFYDGTPAAGSLEEGRNLTYLSTLIRPFVGDDRILGWDLHNEPENYGMWAGRKHPELVVDWLHRMADYVHGLDRSHPLTVGMAAYTNLFAKASDGTRILDFVDFASFHSYDAVNMGYQVEAVRKATSKPLVLQETGWPTGPTCNVLDYNEAAQLRVYTAAQAIFADNRFDLAGVLGWTMWDYRPGQSRGGGVETREDYYGLLRRDGTPKPALAPFKAIKTLPLPSASSTDLPLTAIPFDAQTVANGNREYGEPLYFPETDRYVWDAFKDYWRRFGQREVFGLPLTAARREVLSDGEERTVQYFERARFELHEEAAKTVPGWANLGKGEKLLYLVKLTPLGRVVTSGRDFARAPAPSEGEFAADPTLHYVPETGHTIGGLFYQYWADNRGIATFGYPISQPFNEISATDGKTYLVQYFERQRFEYHSDAATPYKVQLGLLGAQYLTQHGCG